MAVEYKTPGGIILPSNYGTKADRSQPAAVRALGGQMYNTQRFREYSQYLQAVRVPWVHRVVLKIAETFASNDWNLKDGDTIVTDTFDRFLQLIAKPNPWMTGRAFLEMYAMFMELLGEAFITLENRDTEGRPHELYLPNPANMVVIPDPINFVKGYVFVSATGQRIPYDVDEVIHIKMPNPFNPYRGFGPVEAAADLLDTVVNIVGFESSYFRSGGRIVGVLETDYEVSDDDFLKLKEDWKQFSQDEKQRMKTAILQNGLKYTPVAEGMKNIDVTSINNEKRDSILGNWGVPPTKLGIVTGSAEQMREGDHVFHAETMDGKFKRWEDDIQPLIDLFDSARRWEFARKNFEDDTTKLTNSQKMAQTYAYSVDDIRIYNDQDPLPNGAGKVIMVPSQIMPLKLSDLGDIADNQAELSDQTVEPPDPGAPPPGVPNLPSGQKPPAPGGNPQNGTAPGKPVGAGAGEKPGANNPPKKKDVADYSVEELTELAGTKDIDPDIKESLITQIATKTVLAARVSNRLYRQPRKFRAPGLGEKAVRHVSADTAATGLFIRNKLNTFMNDAAQNHTGLKKAFRIQRREVLKALPEILKDAAKVTGAARTKVIREGLASVLEPRTEDLKRAVAPIHVAGLVTGFATGVHVLPPAQASLVRRRMGNNRKEITPEGKGAEWAKYVEDWRRDDVKLAAEFDGLVARAVTNLSDMAITELAEVVEEGSRRSYSVLQVMDGNADEDFGGIHGMMEVIETRSAAVVRAEARDAFNAGVAEALGFDDDLKAAFHGNQYLTVTGSGTHPPVPAGHGRPTAIGPHPVLPRPSGLDLTAYELRAAAAHDAAHNAFKGHLGRAYVESVRQHLLQHHAVDPGWEHRHRAEWVKLHTDMHGTGPLPA